MKSPQPWICNDLYPPLITILQICFRKPEKSHFTYKHVNENKLNMHSQGCGAKCQNIWTNHVFSMHYLSYLEVVTISQAYSRKTEKINFYFIIGWNKTTNKSLKPIFKRVLPIYFLVSEQEILWIKQQKNYTLRYTGYILWISKRLFHRERTQKNRSLP